MLWDLLMPRMEQGPVHGETPINEALDFVPAIFRRLSVISNMPITIFDVGQMGKQIYDQSQFYLIN